MKKFYFSMFMVAAVISSVSGQVARPGQKGKENLFNGSPLSSTVSQKEKAIIPFAKQKVANAGLSELRVARKAAVNRGPLLNYGYRVGYTFFDDQTSGSPQQRIVIGKGRGISMAFTYSRVSTREVAARGFAGIGYNRLVNGVPLWDDFNFGNPDSLNLYPNYFFQTVDGQRVPAERDNGYDGSPGSLTMWDDYGIHYNNVNEWIVGNAYWRIPTDTGNTIYRQALTVRDFDLRTAHFSGYTDGMRPFNAPSLGVTSALSGNNVYVFAPMFASESGDTLQSNLMRNVKVEFVPQMYISSNGGQSYTRQTLPYINAQEGVTGTRIGSAVIDAQGSTVAIALTVFRRSPTPGIETVLLKSDQNGNPGSWTVRVIDAAYFSDTSQVSETNTPGNFSAPINDNYLTLVLDQNNRAHLAAGRGFGIFSNTGYRNNFFFANGGLNPFFGRLLYWNENFAAGQKPRFIAGPVDVNRNGRNEVIGTGAGAPGAYRNSSVSQPSFSIDRQGILYITYSAVVENTEQIGTLANQTRDIYTIYSEDNGRSWSNPINMAALNFFDDGSSGSGSTEEAFPMTPRRIGDTLHMYWMSDLTPGLVTGENVTDVGGEAYDPTAPFAATNWRSNNIAYHPYLTRDIRNQLIQAQFPERMCAGTVYQINYTVPPGIGYPPDNFFYVQMDRIDSNETANFDVRVPGQIINMNRLQSQTSGTIPIHIQQTFPPGTYAIRIRASALSNFADEVVSIYPDAIYYPRPAGAISSEQIVTISDSLPVSAGIRLRNFGANTVCPGTAVSFQQTAFNTDAEASFSVLPNNAGRAFYSDNSNVVTVLLNKDFRGKFVLVGRELNACGFGNFYTSDSVTVQGPSLSINGRTMTISGTTGPFQWLYNPDEDPTDDIVAGQTGATYTAPVDSTGLYEVLSLDGCRSQVLYLADDVLPTERIIVSAKEEIALANSVNIYPNPTSDFSRVELKGFAGNTAAQIQVINQLGQVVGAFTAADENGSQVVDINTSKYAKGVYIVRIQSANQMIAKKLIVR